MSLAMPLTAIVLPENNRGVWISHVLAWSLFVAIPVISASPAFAYMSMYVWVAQFLVLSVRCMMVFYLMYLLVVPAMHQQGGFIRFVLLFGATVLVNAIGTAVIDTMFIQATTIVPTPVNGELSMWQMTNVWAITYGMIGIIAIAGRITFDWFTVARNWYRSNLEPISMMPSNNDYKRSTVESVYQKPSEIWVRSSGDDVRLKVEDIWYVESMKDYVAYHGAFGRVMVYQRLKDASAQLESYGFQRIHRSFAVNEAHIAKRSASAVVVAGKELPVGRTYR